MMTRLMRGLWSLAWLLALLVGVPAGLVHYIGWPLPHHWPTAQEWQLWLAKPLTRTTLLHGAAIIAWLLWALLLYAVMVEILTRARRAVGWLRGMRLPPLPTPMQATASGMLGAAVFGIPTGSAHLAAPPAATPPVAAPMAPAGTTLSADATNPDRPAVPVAREGHPAVNEPDAAVAERGVTLPDGGWVTEQTAHAIASAAALVWWQRRRRYVPRPPTGAVRDDPDLAPLPPTVTAVQDILYRREHPDDAPDLDEDEVDSRQPVGEPTPAAGVTGEPATRTIRPGDLPAGGVGLTGPGALAAARGLLTAALLSAGTGPHGGDARLITTADDLDALLGPDATAHQATPGLIVVHDLDGAIALLEQHLLKHRRVTANHAVPADAAASPDPGFAPVVLLTRVPSDPASGTRLAVLLLCTHLGVTGALLGDWPHGDTWRIDDHGYTHPADTSVPARARLCVLTPTATVDLLTLLREARPQLDRPPDLEPPPSPAPASDPHTSRFNTGNTSAIHRPRAPGRQAATAPDHPATAPLRLRLLGTPTLHHTDDTKAPVAIQRAAALQILIFLAVHRRGATSNQLIGALWPGPRPAHATNRLYTPVNKLRAALREATGADVLVRDGDRYRLDDQHIDVDLWRLRAAVDHAATAIDPAERHRALRAVIDGYTGELAADKEWSWLATPREATRRHVVDAYLALADDEPDPHTALALLQDAIRIDPANEDLQRRAQQAAHTG
jgi:DNA-binding SARP family transcriptional activator